LDLFIETLKDKIQHEVRLFKLTSLEKAFMVARKVESKNLVMATRRITYNTSRETSVPSSNLPQPTRLTPQQMDERREKELCFNCDSKYKWHKFGEKKLFYIDYEKEEADDQDQYQAEEIKGTTHIRTISNQQSKVTAIEFSGLEMFNVLKDKRREP
jgi:hypothetical protein